MKEVRKMDDLNNIAFRFCDSIILPKVASKLFLSLSFLCFFFQITAQVKINSINPEIRFGGDYIIYKGQKIQLGAKAFYIDGQLSNKDVRKYPYVFNSIQAAAAKLTDGTEDIPMTLYIAPWVYWIDNPDDPAIRIPKEGFSVPFGMEIKCEWLKFLGLSDNPYQVILAANRGQTMGAKGNFTLFNISGDGLCTENITFGNYCNIDLIYPPNPKLNRSKRGAAIVQGQLVFADGDKIVARNTNFISRLNTGVFWGSKRALFDRCHFESTDDAMNNTGVHLNCTFDFYSSKPWGNTSGTGVVLLNCDIKTIGNGDQYLVKGGGQVAMVDTRFSGSGIRYLGWRDIPTKEARYYQSNVSLNGNQVIVGENNASETVNMTGKEILDAYCFDYNNQLIYNTYNLLRGDDGWDPMQIKTIVEKAEQESGRNYSSIPTQILISPTKKTLETGKDSLLLTSTLYRFGNFKANAKNICWIVSGECSRWVQLRPQKDGNCWVIPTNTDDETHEVIISALTESGLEASSVLNIAPSFLPPPAFIQKPNITSSKDGKIKVNYQLDMPYRDESQIRWYRCSDSQGSNPIEVAVSRLKNPMKVYELSTGDVGYYLMVRVAPKHLRCHFGNVVETIYSEKILSSDVKQNVHILIPNLENISLKYQPRIIPGFWSFDSYAPTDTHEHDWIADNSGDAWYYGRGVNGAAQDTGWVQAIKGARMRYQPVGEKFGDMKVSFIAVPAKTAGQGFSSARAQYMDIGLKMDLQTMSGYAVRLIRTTKYSDAIDVVLMKYENGNVHPISQAVTTSCYRPSCKITAEIKGGVLKVHAENLSHYFVISTDANVKRVVDLETKIAETTFGGFSIQHTGTVDGGATLIKDLKIEWL